MVKQIIKGALHAVGLDLVRWPPPPPPPEVTPSNMVHPDLVGQRDLIRLMAEFPRFQDKLELIGHFSSVPEQAAWLDKRKQGLQPPPARAPLEHPGKLNYGCGSNFMQGWLNLDLTKEEREGYAYVDLLDKHPFRDNSARFAYSEDMIEHLTQPQSIFVISEIFRVLAPGGIARLTFPSLEGVLQKHYNPPSAHNVLLGELDAYETFDHLHFYSREELRLVATHLGFREVAFFSYRESPHAELRGLDTRDTQTELNLYAELTK